MSDQRGVSNSSSQFGSSLLFLKKSIKQNSPWVVTIIARSLAVMVSGGRLDQSRKFAEIGYQLLVLPLG